MNPFELFQSLPGALSFRCDCWPPDYDPYGRVEHKEASFTDFNSATRFCAAFPDWDVAWEMFITVLVATDPNWKPQKTDTSPENLFDRLLEHGRGHSFDENTKTVRFRQFNEAAVFKATFPDWQVEYIFQSAVFLEDDEINLEAAPYV